MGTDVEKSKDTQHEILDGYADFAELIAYDPEFFIFRSFGSLGARNLLYFQAELQVLESQLKKLDKLDQEDLRASNDRERKKAIEKAARDWVSLAELSERKANQGQQHFRQDDDVTERQAKKMELILRIRQVMKA